MERAQPQQRTVANLVRLLAVVTAALSPASTNALDRPHSPSIDYYRGLHDGSNETEVADMVASNPSTVMRTQASVDRGSSSSSSSGRRSLLSAGCVDDAPQRVLVYTSQKTGGSLMVDALGQFPRTVTLDLYPGKEGPEPGVLPRPMSAFQIYAREVMDEYVKNSPTAKKEELFKAIGDKFFSMPASQSAPYKLKEEESKQPENRIMVVMKAVTNPWTLGWQYVANFKPDARILFVRHPAHVVKALKITPDNEKSAAKKLKQLDHAFAARDRLFNETIFYEELVMDQAKVATSLTNLGFCPKTVSTMLSFKAKSTQDLVDFNLKECDWCERTKWKEWDAKGTKNKVELSSHLVDKRPGPADRAIAAKTCPQMTAYYASKYPKL